MLDWLNADDIAYLSDAVSTWLAYGIGLGAVFWLVGQVVAIIFKFVRF